MASRRLGGCALAFTMTTTASLKERAINGAIWTIGGYGLSQVLRFGCNFWLTQLLIPEYFGLMAVVNTLRIGVELFSDVGIPQSIVNNKNGDDPVFLDTAWTLQVIRGAVLSLICLGLTYPAAQFYNDARLLHMLPAIALVPVLEGFVSTNLYLCQRNLDLARYTIYDLGLQVVCLALTIAWARVLPNEWALVFGAVEAVLIKAVSSFWLFPGTRHRFVWQPQYVREIFSFGRWIFVATALMFAAEQTDRLLLGKLIGFKLLGIYAIAYTLATLPKEVVKALSYKVIFPAVAQQLDIPRSELRQKIIRSRAKLILGFGLLSAVLLSFGDLFIQIYGTKYLSAQGMFPILCVGVWFSIMFYTTSPALMAIGKPLYSAQSNLARFITVAFGILLGHHFYGTQGAIVAIALSDIPLYLVNLYGLWREGLLCLRQDIQMTGWVLLAMIGCLLVRVACGLGLPIHPI